VHTTHSTRVTKKGGGIIRAMGTTVVMVLAVVVAMKVEKAREVAATK